MTAPQTNATINVAEALARLRTVLRATKDLRPVLGGPINSSVDQLFRRQFNSEGAFGGQKWAPLRPVTKLLRQRPGHGRGGIGRDTNRMWASLTKFGVGPDAIKILTPSSLERGTSLPYARWFSQGYISKTKPVLGSGGRLAFIRRRAPKRIPPRPLVPDPTPRSLTKAWETLIARFVEGS